MILIAKKRKSKYYNWKKNIKVNGKNYKYYFVYDTETEANNRAKEMKGEGWNTAIRDVKLPMNDIGFRLYRRKRKR